HTHTTPRTSLPHTCLSTQVIAYVEDMARHTAMESGLFRSAHGRGRIGAERLPFPAERDRIEDALDVDLVPQREHDEHPQPSPVAVRLAAAVPPEQIQRRLTVDPF